MRLERCFLDPFAADGYVVYASASIGIALFPENGESRDSLLSAADSAMYVVKQTKQNRGEKVRRRTDSELNPVEPGSEKPGGCRST